MSRASLRVGYVPEFLDEVFRELRGRHRRFPSRREAVLEAELPREHRERDVGPRVVLAAGRTRVQAVRRQPTLDLGHELSGRSEELVVADEDLAVVHGE